MNFVSCKFGLRLYLWFQITRIIPDQIAFHSVQLLNNCKLVSKIWFHIGCHPSTDKFDNSHHFFKRIMILKGETQLPLTSPVAVFVLNFCENSTLLLLLLLLLLLSLSYHCYCYFVIRTFFVGYDGQRWVDNPQENWGNKSERNRNGIKMIASYFGNLLSVIHCAYINPQQFNITCY